MRPSGTVLNSELTFFYVSFLSFIVYIFFKIAVGSPLGYYFMLVICLFLPCIKLIWVGGI